MVFDMQAWMDAFAGADDLKFREMRVLLVMQRYATSSTGRDVRPGLAAVAAFSGVSLGNLRGKDGVIQSLVEKGWLVRVREATLTRPAEYALGFGSHRARPVPSPRVREGEGQVDEVGGPQTGDQVPNLGTSPNWGGGGPQTGAGGGPQTGAGVVPKLGTLPTQDLHKDLHTTLTAREAVDVEVVDAVVEDEPTLDLVQAAVAKADAQIEAATLLGRRLADSLKDRGIPPAYTRQWTNEMCRILESGATPHQVEYIIDYLPSDTFWSGLVVDAKYFADKYPKLVAAARSHVHKQVNAERPAWMQERERRRAAAQHEPS